MRVRQRALAGGVKHDGGKDERGEGEAISYAFTPAVLLSCIYETLSNLKVKDQRMKSKAFSEWGGQISKEMRNPGETHSSLLSPPPRFTITRPVIICNTTHQNVSLSL